jgi:predicted ester cyclase
MGIEENKEVVRREIEEIRNKGNLNLIPDLFAPNYVYHQSGQQDEIGHKGLREHVERGRGAFPDLHLKIEDMIAVDDKVVVRYSSSGTHKGKIMGIAPTGNEISPTGISILRIENNMIVEEWCSHDMLTTLQQIGAIPT